MDKSTDQMTFMDEERVILVDREDNIIGSATKRVRLLDFIAPFCNARSIVGLGALHTVSPARMHCVASPFWFEQP